jgi:DNA-binding NtrC family response regulator
MNKRYHLLFVDDEERVLRSLKSLFRRDYRVSLASSGAQALEILEQSPVDVIVSDQRMPKMNGNELLAKVHQQYPQVMRLLLTGYVDKDAIIDTINEGEIFRFISKPWDIPQIKSTIAQAAAASKHQVPQALVLEAERNPLMSEHESQNAKRLLNKIKDASELEKKALSEVRSKTKTPSSKAHPQSIQKTAFVLMEKDLAVRNTIRSLSRKLGFRIYAINSYMQAARTLSLRPDVGVVIMSIEENTQETLEAINLFKRYHPGLTIIMLANMTDATVAIQLINEGQVFRYLQKPLSTSDFERAVKSAIRRHQMLQEKEQLQERYKVGLLASTLTSLQKLRQFLK